VSLALEIRQVSNEVARDAARLDLANRLLHPRYEIPRVYEVQVERRVRAEDLPRWRRGAELPDGPAVPRSVRIIRGEGRGDTGTTWLEVTFAEGRYREVKRYCKALGHPVLRLRRVQFGPLRLGSLPVGRCRELTAREREILRLIVAGLSNAEIGKELYISDTTVKTHVTHILQKLDLRDRVQAVVLAYETGLFDLRQP
jgi:pseudouridine synthase